MKKTIKVTLAVFALASTAWAFQKASKRSTFVDETYGFSLESPKFPGVTPTTPGVPLILTGPASNGTAPNVNVTIQATSTTLKAYRDLSIGQFEPLKLKLNSERQLKVSGRDAIEFDYEGVLGGTKALRFLSLSVIDKNRVILVTCTTTPETFAALESEFRACLKSFKLP